MKIEPLGEDLKELSEISKCPVLSGKDCRIVSWTITIQTSLNCYLEVFILLVASKDVLDNVRETSLIESESGTKQILVDLINVDNLNHLWLAETEQISLATYLHCERCGPVSQLIEDYLDVWGLYTRVIKCKAYHCHYAVCHVRGEIELELSTGIQVCW